MSKNKIWLAILGGCVVGGLSTAGVIFTDYATVYIGAASVVAAAVALYTGIQVKK